VFDHGGFLDECTLRLVAFEEKEDLQQRLLWIERNAPRNDGDVAVSKWLHQQYCGIQELTAVDDLLKFVRPQTRVIWLGRTPCPLNLNSQRLNRVLDWRLCELGHVDYEQGDLTAIKTLNQEHTAGFRYEAIVTQAGSDRVIPAHQVVARIGSDSALERWFPAVYSALRKSLPAGATSLHDAVNDAYIRRYADLNKERRASNRRSDLKFRAKPEYPIERDGKTYFRIWIWLVFDWALEHIAWVEYDLHPEYGGIHRRAMRMKEPQARQHFRRWVNPGTISGFECDAQMAWSSEVGYRMWLGKRTQVTIRRLKKGARNTCEKR
jgi:hypothetical protein